MLTAIPVRWLEDKGWRVKTKLTTSGKVLPASCRQIVLSPIASSCRQDAGSTLNTSGSAAAPAALAGALAGENTSRWTFNVQGLPQHNIGSSPSPESEQAEVLFYPRNPRNPWFRFVPSG